MSVRDVKRFVLLSTFTFLITSSSIIFLSTQVKGYEITREKLHFEILTLAGDSTSNTGGLLIKNYLEAVGFKIDHRAESSDVLFPKFLHFGGTTIRHYDLIYMPDSIDPIRPVGLFVKCHSPIDVTGGGNICAIHNSTLDDHLLAMFTSPYPGEVQYHVYQQQTIFAEEIPFIPILYLKECIPVWNGMAGLVSTPYGLISELNPLTTLNLHNITNLPDNRNGLECITRYPYFVRESNEEGMLYYQASTGRTRYLDRLLWESLVIVNETGEIIPWLAESYTISPDKLTYNFTLRENIKWHDGVLMTPEDVRFSFEYIKSHESQIALFPPTYDIESCTIDSNGIISFTLYDYVNWELIDFCDFLIFPKHIFESIPYNHPSWHDLSNLTTKLGSGPYKFDRVESTIQPSWWQFTRNENYWFTGGMNTSLIKGIQYPRMEKFTIQVINDVNETVEAMKKGEIDFCLYHNPVLMKTRELFPAQIKLFNSSYSDVSIWSKLLFINNQIYPLSDRIVRQAIAYALDYASIVQEAEKGYAIPVYGQSFPQEVYGTWHNPSSDIYRYNVTQANYLLDNAGYLDIDGDGIREVPFNPNTTSSTTNTSSSQTNGIGSTITLILCNFVLAVFCIQRKGSRS